MIRIILAHDAQSAWLELLPALRTAFRDEVEVDEFVLRATSAGFQIVAEGTDLVAQRPERRLA